MKKVAKRLCLVSIIFILFVAAVFYINDYNFNKKPSYEGIIKEIQISDKNEIRLILTENKNEEKTYFVQYNKCNLRVNEKIMYNKLENNHISIVN